MFARLVAPHSEEIVKIDALRKELQDQPLSVYSDLTMLPLFSTMDISQHYHPQPNALLLDAHPSPDAVKIMMCPVHSFSCKLLYDNHFADDYNFKPLALVHMFGYDWEITDVSVK